MLDKKAYNLFLVYAQNQNNVSKRLSPIRWNQTGKDHAVHDLTFTIINTGMWIDKSIEHFKYAVKKWSVNHQHNLEVMKSYRNSLN